MCSVGRCVGFNYKCLMYLKVLLMYVVCMLDN